MSDEIHLPPGLIGEASVTVTAENTAAALGSGSVNVFSTPAMIALMEAAAINAVADHLPDGLTTVGISLNVKHMAATPIGMTVKARATLKLVEGRRLEFEISAWDPLERIGEGTHERFIVDHARFEARVQKKAD
jgi:fluoroacetyl-CoA thioesterase